MARKRRESLEATPIFRSSRLKVSRVHGFVPEFGGMYSRTLQKHIEITSVFETREAVRTREDERHRNWSNWRIVVILASRGFRLRQDMHREAFHMVKDLSQEYSPSFLRIDEGIELGMPRTRSRCKAIPEHKLLVNAVKRGQQVIVSDKRCLIYHAGSTYINRTFGIHEYGEDVQADAWI